MYNAIHIIPDVKNPVLAGNFLYMSYHTTHNNSHEKDEVSERYRRNNFAISFGVITICSY